MSASGSDWDVNWVMSVLPHRYPFLLVDRVVEIEPRRRIVAEKNVTINEPYFNGHFPGHPVMPGVLLVEGMAQAAAILLLSEVDNPEETLFYFASIEKASFRHPVVPGDRIRYEVDVLRLRTRYCKLQGKAFVGDQIAAEATCSSAMVKR